MAQLSDEVVERLTRPQLRLLAKAEQATFWDGSGRGHAPWSRTEVRVAERLAKLGLATVTMPTFGSVHGYVRVTDAGRAAIAAYEAKGDIPTLR